VDGIARAGMKRWQRLGYGLTIAWLVAAVLASGGDRGHPMFEHIFTAPLAAWVAALVIARVLAATRARRQDRLRCDDVTGDRKDR